MAVEYKNPMKSMADRYAAQGKAESDAALKTQAAKTADYGNPLKDLADRYTPSAKSPYDVDYGNPLKSMAERYKQPMNPDSTGLSYNGYTNTGITTPYQLASPMGETAVPEFTDPTKSAPDNYGLTAPGAYNPSQAVLDAAERLKGLNVPDAYSSSYQAQIDSLLEKVLNKEKFSYDFNADPLYQQYKDQYTANGNTAMQDTMAQAAALSGGFGNSYAATAGNQTYNSYMQELNNVIPQLEQAAYEKYQYENSDLYNQLGTVQGLEDTEYGRYRNDVSDYNNNRNYLADMYNTEYSKDYGEYRDGVGDYNNERAYATDRADTEFNRQYQQYLDNLGQSNYEREFSYNQQQDALAQDNYLKELAYNQSQDAFNNNLKLYSSYSGGSDAGSSSDNLMSFDDVNSNLRSYLEQDGSAAWDYLGYLGRQGKIDEDAFNTFVAMYGIKDPDESTAVDYSVYDVDNPFQSNYPRQYLDPNGRKYYK